MKNQTRWYRKLGIGALALVFGLGAGIAFGDISGGTSGATSGGEQKNLVTDGGAESGTMKNWLRVTSVSDDAHSGNHSFKVNGYAVAMSKQVIEIDPDKSYTLSGWFKSVGEKPSRIYFGLAPLDAKKRSIQPWRVNALADTATTLTAACAKGDTVLKIEDASKWKANNYSGVAFDVAADFSDLPNRQITRMGITAVENKGDHWEVTLKHPCNYAKAAGTPVRVHRSAGTYMYSGAANKTVRGEWTEFKSQKIKGMAINGFPPKKFWTGTRYVRIMILANYQMKKDGVLLVDDLKLTAD